MPFTGLKTFSVEMEPGLKIYTLGRYQVYYKDLQLSAEHGRSRKIWDLLMYLITQSDKTTSPGAIVEALWPEQDYANLNGSVKNLVHRLRKKIEDNEFGSHGPAIIHAHGCYGWNKSYPYWLDAEVFEELCREAKLLAEKDPALACTKYCQALSLYGGEYLPDCLHSEWVQPIRQYYKLLFIDSIKHLVALYKGQGSYKQIIETCEKTLFVERFEEDLHICYLEALLEENKTTQARIHYEYVTRLFYEELGEKPTAKMKSIYRKIRESINQIHDKHLGIEEILNERDNSDGPIICELDIFQILCKVEKRRADREDRPVQVGILSFDTGNSNLSLSSIFKRLSDNLSDNLSGTFRKGDVFTILNEAQIAILLPGATYKQAEEILKRANQNFIKHYFDESVNVHSSVHPIIPIENL